MSGRELTDIKAQKKGETDKAYRIFDGIVTVWVPKSYVEHDEDAGVFTMPEWLAIDKGLA